MSVAVGGVDLCPVGLGTQFGRCPDLKQTDSSGYRRASLGHKADEIRSQRLGSTVPRHSATEKKAEPGKKRTTDI